MASTCSWPDTQPASDGRGPAGEQLLQVFPGPGGVARLLGVSHVFMTMNNLNGFFQIRIPSKADKPGGSPVRQKALEVSSGAAEQPPGVINM